MSRRRLIEAVVVAAHGELIAEHGGREGIRDGGWLSSALARPQQRAAYGDPSVFDLAAAYAFGIICNHPFIDGNKRTGFLVAHIFLDLNGRQLTAPEPEAVAAMLSLANGEMDEAGFSAWLKDRSVIRSGHE